MSSSPFSQLFPFQHPAQHAPFSQVPGSPKPSVHDDPSESSIDVQLCSTQAELLHGPGSGQAMQLIPPLPQAEGVVPEMQVPNHKQLVQQLPSSHLPLVQSVPSGSFVDPQV